MPLETSYWQPRYTEVKTDLAYSRKSLLSSAWLDCLALEKYLEFLKKMAREKGMMVK